jgi:hypothetical protein
MPFLLSTERREFLRKEIGIPETWSSRQFPFYELEGMYSVNGDIQGIVKAWKKINSKIANRIVPVIQKHLKTNEEIFEFIDDISGIEHWEETWGNKHK